VAHTCNPSYLGCRDPEDCGSKLSRANNLQDPISKKTHHKKGLVEWLKVQALSSKSQYFKKKKKCYFSLTLFRVVFETFFTKTFILKILGSNSLGSFYFKRPKESDY
jgi:hypothetical protein